MVLKYFNSNMNLEKLTKLTEINIKENATILNIEIESYNKKIKGLLINSITIIFKFTIVISVFNMIILKVFLNNPVY